MKITPFLWMLSMTVLLFPSADQLDWRFDFDEAQELASSSEKKVLIVFSGSDWCKPCIQLHRTLFESPEFLNYADEHLILVKADFPYRKKNKLSDKQTRHNEELAAYYNPNGEFPLAVFTDEEGNVLGSFGFDKSKLAAEYILEFKHWLK